MPFGSTDGSSGDSLSSGLVRAWRQDHHAPRSGIMPDLAAGAHGVFVGNQDWTIQQNRLMVRHASADSPSISCGTIAEIAGAAKISIFAVGYKNSGSGTLAVGCINSGNNRVAMGWLGGTFYLMFENGAASSPAVGSSASGRVTFGATYDGTETGWARDKAWINGVAQTLTPAGSSPPATLTASAGDFKIGPMVLYSSYADGLIGLVYLWVGRAITDHEHQLLHRDPDILFRRSPDRALVGLEQSVGAAYLALQGGSV